MIILKYVDKILAKIIAKTAEPIKASSKSLQNINRLNNELSYKVLELGELIQNYRNECLTERNNLELILNDINKNRADINKIITELQKYNGEIIKLICISEKDLKTLQKIKKLFSRFDMGIDFEELINVFSNSLEERKERAKSSVKALTSVKYKLREIDNNLKEN